jgi:hypothetical protein
MVKGTTSKLLEVVLEEKRREIIKEWINSGRGRSLFSLKLVSNKLSLITQYDNT